MYPSQQKAAANYRILILLFVALKLLLNSLAGGRYGFHRDEMLHLTLGDHLAWGYKEVPPFIALLAKLALMLFGSTSVIGARVFTAIASALIVLFTGLLPVEFGGRKFAITIACLSVVVSPAMAASGYLFQPVVFDQLWWLIAAWLTVKYANTEERKYMYWLGMVIGCGMLTKYTMAFFTGALLVGILFTPSRKWLLRKEVGIAVILALFIFLPNVLWQYVHHWPVVTHMHKLKSQQLDYVKPTDFILQQLLLHGILVIVWFTGLLFLLFHKSMRLYRFVGIAYLLVFIFLLKMNGKPYYLLAAYPMLFAAGGYGIALILQDYKARTMAAVALLAPNLIMLPIVLPILNITQVRRFFEYTHQHMPVLDFAVTWEDHKRHPITQDYADMFGWEEMVQKVASTYHNLPLEAQKHTVIFADNYGEAGALHLYRHRYKLPDVVCLNSSFAIWAPESLRTDYIIYVSDDNDVSDLQPVVEGYKRVGGIDNQLAREYGTGIFLVMRPKAALGKIYQQHLEQTRNE
ncbi:ArnT family glycosyltransferase [Mucilaginibacter lacusdianchii]|uniref:ArnT family glycosyltransferase n=1 Tax=Mucilaginibacter lacusdianchii TaxID=2684211 RepID=UPI00131BAB4A|nr:glycosyltransferase family 39 protein [Mucilaginibacter sp. JXJ CY 39]